MKARRILVTAGLLDELPDIAGLRDRWGRDVLHCPYCHGWEVRDQRIGVLANGPRSVHQALLFRQLSDDITYFTNDTPLTKDEAEQLEARGIDVTDTRISALEVTDDRLTGVRLADDTVVHVDAFAVMPHMVARATFLAGLGLQAVPHPSGMANTSRLTPPAAPRSPASGRPATSPTSPPNSAHRPQQERSQPSRSTPTSLPTTRTRG